MVSCSTRTAPAWPFLGNSLGSLEDREEEEEEGEVDMEGEEEEAAAN